jgi:predicted acetyltransferase
MVEIRAIEAGEDKSEVDGFRDCLMQTFGGDRDGDPEAGARVRALVAPGRAWAAFDRGAIVGTAASFTLTLGVPGGTLPMAGLTMVSVRPTHRRRGLLREMMRRHVDDARARGEPISGLWASEATIYGRFGFGIAAWGDAIDVDTRGLTITAEGGDVCEWLEEAEARERLPAIYERAIADRPGALHRSPVWWHERRFLESPFARLPASRRRYVVVSRGGEPVGYLAYRQRGQFDAGVPAGSTEAAELIAIDPRAEASLWQFILGIDLFPTAAWWNAPTDTTLPWIVSDVRKLKRRRVDTLWLRIDDVAAALGARRYPVDGELRFSTGDATWQLVVEGGRGRCARGDAAPQLTVDPHVLGAMLLGGAPLPVLARAGRVAGPAETVAAADRMFGWPVAPWCPEMF